MRDENKTSKMDIAAIVGLAIIAFYAFFRWVTGLVQ